MQLAKADSDSQRFYSMSAQIRLERSTYYEILERTQKGTHDITEWLEWFLHCLDRALNATDEILKRVLNKTKFWDAHANTAINERQRLLINKLFDGFNGKLSSSKWVKIAKCSPDTLQSDSWLFQTATGFACGYTPTTANIHIPEQIARGVLKFSPDGSKLISLEVPDDTCNMLNMQFRDISTLFPDKINFWKWDFGDISSGSLNHSSFAK